ncbi:MAG: tetratricopeptide repeat protein [Candidatus Manganitrophus sp.]|nr:tetratricopeptide repeat protein [Candidatus Manganitrophus sp.]
MRRPFCINSRGKFDQSISYLQKIDSQSSEYYQASLLLGQLLVEKGMIDAARERYQKIISQETIGPENLEFYYQLALVHEKQKEFEEAQNLYEKILAEDYSYRDAKTRSTLLKRALTEVKKVLDATRIEEATARPVAAPVQHDHLPRGIKSSKRSDKAGWGSCIRPKIPC